MRAKRSKYGAVATVVDGIRFASKKEARRYQELTLLQKAGEIMWLRCQVPFQLDVDGVLVGRYVADFQYAEKRDGDWAMVREDAKGVRTPVYKLKAKLMKAIYGITIREV